MLTIWSKWRCLGRCVSEAEKGDDDSETLSRHSAQKAWEHSRITLLPHDTKELQTDALH